MSVLPTDNATIFGWLVLSAAAPIYQPSCSINQMRFTVKLALPTRFSQIPGLCRGDLYYVPIFLLLRLNVFSCCQVTEEDSMGIVDRTVGLHHTSSTVAGAAHSSITSPSNNSKGGPATDSSMVGRPTRGTQVFINFFI